MAPVNGPLVVVLGPTGCGKTALGIALAQQFNGEIICADSRTIYMGMDIGTAKPTAAERQGIPHHMLDIIEPNETFSAAAFKKRANECILDIASRGKLPIMVGGTGLYIDSVLFDYEFGDAADVALRHQLETKSVSELQAIITERGYTLPENHKNKRYLIRTIERNGDAGRRSGLRTHTLVLGVTSSLELLRPRLAERVDQMIEAGFVTEARVVIRKYGSDAPGCQAPGYKAFAPYFKGMCTFDEARENFVKNDTHLAKRQATWFRRTIYQNSIHWVANRLDTVALVTSFLNK